MVTTGFLDNRTLFYRHKVSLCIDAYLRLPPSRAGQVRRAVADVFPVRQNADIPTCLLGAQWQDADAIDEICLQLGVDVDEYLRTATPYLSSAQVRTLAADGFTIGAHGTNHVPLNLLPQPALEQDILSSCGTVSQLVGSREVPFAFPFNGRGVNQEMLRQLRASYPEVGLFFGTGMLARDQEFIVNRIVVDEPPRPGRSVTNMPEQMRRAYANELARPVKGIIRRLLAK
jgi:peptidoglycan/xylan/chitin deacetylase (PgdA/CDA1 family)